MAALLASAKLGAGLAQQLVDFIGSFITISDRDSEFGMHEQTDLVELWSHQLFGILNCYVGTAEIGTFKVDPSK